MTKHRAANRLSGFILCLGVFVLSFSTASVAQPQQPPMGPVPHRMVPLEHIYWYFLLYQNHLDSRAAEFIAQNKNPGTLGTRMEKSLGWSDADFAPVRTSAARLASEAKDLRTREAALRSLAPASRAAQSVSLGLERSADIAAEVSYLRSNLSPTQFTAFETFLNQLFTQPAAPGTRPVITIQSTTTPEVQK